MYKVLGIQELDNYTSEFLGMESSEKTLLKMYS